MMCRKGGVEAVAMLPKCPILMTMSEGSESSSAHLNTVSFLDEQYGFRRDGNSLMIGSAGVIATKRAISL